MSPDTWGFDTPAPEADPDLVLGVWTTAIGIYQPGMVYVFTRSELEVLAVRGYARQSGDSLDAARHLRHHGPHARFDEGAGR